MDNALTAPPRAPAARWPLVAFLAVAAAVVATGGWYANRPAVAGGPPPAPAPIVVEAVAPTPGGIERRCVQPGSLEPFEAADLYAKVSGFLVEQAVDIGSRVKKGDVLARLSVPEYEKQVLRDTADVKRADARVQQMTAAVTTAEADLRAAAATVSLAQAESKSKTSYRAYREKQRERIQSLASQQAIDAKLADEQEDQYQSSVGAELAAVESVNTAKQKEAAARAKVEQAKADLKYAEAEVAVARAQLEKSAVLLEYAVIRSPYDGVVTRRNFHPGDGGRPGDFVRAADGGGDRTPVLSVERTDVMRLVVQVPDRDVPYVSVGDPATVRIDALPDVLLETHGTDTVAIARSAESEDPHTRTMRTEIDLKNPDGRLRRGMYGRVTILLQAGAPNAVRVPSAALVGKAGGGKGAVRVVRGDRAVLVPVRLGTDTGAEVEILSGVTAADRVVLRANGPVDDATPVTAVEAKASAGGH